MSDLKTLFNFCYHVMSIELHFWGYSFTLFSVVAFSIGASFVLFILFKMLH